MTIHAEYQTPKGERMNAIDELRQYIDNRGEQLIADGNGMYRPDTELQEILERLEREWIELPKDADDETIDKWISYAINRACTIEDQPDSWESLHDDLAMMSNDATAADVVRRCKALSERGE